MSAKRFEHCTTLMWYDQYCENYYDKGFKDYSIESVMRDLDRIDADVYAIYATNQWGIAYYDSEVMPTYPPLSGRDYFGEVVAALKERGKKIIAYVNWLDSRHPEWSWRRLSPSNELQPLPSNLQELAQYSPQGKGPVYKRRYGEWFTPCINSPRREEIVQTAREIVARYPIDAFHLDMFFNHGICLCDHCRPRVTEILGTTEITYPGVCDHWGDYLSWRQEVSTSLIAELADIAHRRGVGFAPNAFCPLYTDPLMAVNPAWWNHLDVYVTEAWLRLVQGYADAHSTTLVCKWLRALGKPGMVLITGQHPGFSHAPLAEAEYEMHAASALSNGRPILGSCGQGAYPSTASSQEAVRTMGRVFADYAQRAGHEARETVQQIAVLWSEATRNFYQPGDDTMLYRAEFLGFCRSLIENHRIFDILLPERIESVDDLAGYELLILPNVACMNEALAELIRRYLASGGKVLATWDTGLCDLLGRRRERRLLDDVLGVSYEEPYPFGTFYVMRELEPSVCVGGAARVIATTATVLSPLIEPDPDYPDVGQNSDLVPGSASPYPMLTRNAFGRGTAWYLAGSVGYSAYTLGYYQTLNILSELFDSLELHDRYHLEAPPTVEISMETDAKRTLYVHLANRTVPAYLPGRRITRSIDSVIPLRDLLLRLYGPYRAEDVTAGESVTVKEVEGGIECRIESLEHYEMITVRDSGIDASPS